jgi:hypothetical protein
MRAPVTAAEAEGVAGAAVDRTGQAVGQAWANARTATEENYLNDLEIPS